MAADPTRQINWSRVGVVTDADAATQSAIIGMLNIGLMGGTVVAVMLLSEVVGPLAVSMFITIWNLVVSQVGSWC